MSYDPHAWHGRIIAGIAGSYPEPVYIEIGVATARCFNEVLPHCKIAHAVDPDRHAGTNIDRMVQPASGLIPPVSRFWNMPSDRFFKTFDGLADVIFIDGKHTYAQAKRDFQNADKILRPGGTIILHDVWPGSVADTRESACGDVYKLAEDLVDAMISDETPEWRTFLFGRFPGLLICQRPEDNRVWSP